MFVACFTTLAVVPVSDFLNIFFSNQMMMMMWGFMSSDVGLTLGTHNQMSSNFLFPFTCIVIISPDLFTRVPLFTELPSVMN